MLYSAANQEVIDPLLETYSCLLYGLGDGILHWDTRDRFGEICAFRTPVVLACSDGTVLRCRYRSGWWEIVPMIIGSALIRIQHQEERISWYDSISQKHQLGYTDLAGFDAENLRVRKLIAPQRNGIPL